MAAFVSGEQTISAATATKIVDAESFDRRVYVHDSSVGSLRVAFTSGAAPTGLHSAVIAPAGGGGGTNAANFVLPADQELWVYSASSVTVQFLVTTA